MEKPVILFDGVCNLCNGFVGFIIRHDHDKVFRFASLQSGFGQKILKENKLPSDEFFSVLLVRGDAVFQHSDAVIEIARSLRGFGWLGIFRIFPRFFRDFLYRLVAKNRYRLFGREDSCMLPTPELRDRFI